MDLTRLMTNKYKLGSRKNKIDFHQKKRPKNIYSPRAKKHLNKQNTTYATQTETKQCAPNI